MQKNTVNRRFSIPLHLRSPSECGLSKHLNILFILKDDATKVGKFLKANTVEAWISRVIKTVKIFNQIFHLLKMGLLRPLFVYFRSFQTQILLKKYVGVSGIRTRIVRVADHLTTTTATLFHLLR